MREFKKWYFRIYLFFVRILIVSMIIGISFPVHVFGTTELKQLYALSAVLMDADSGRILFSKNGQEERAMASTTKIMTCILALESGIIDLLHSVWPGPHFQTRSRSPDGWHRRHVHEQCG